MEISHEQVNYYEKLSKFLYYFQRFFTIFKNFLLFSKVFYYFQRFFVIFKDFLLFSKISCYFQSFSIILYDANAKRGKIILKITDKNMEGAK